jgi:hypothetical protein
MIIQSNEITPTQRRAIVRHRNFREAIAAKADELAHRKANEALRMLRVVSLETPLSRTPAIQTIAPEAMPAETDPPPSNWFVICAREPRRSEYPSILQIQKAVAAHFKTTVADIVSRRRTADIVLPRQIAVYLCKEMTLHSYPQIGRRFGDRDHTTQIHSVQKIKGMINRDANFAALISSLIAQLGAICA